MRLVNKKILKFIWQFLLWSSVVFILAIVSLSVFIYFSQDKIEKYLIDKLNERLISKVYIEDTDVTFIPTFPYVSMVFNRVTIIEAYNPDELKDTLLNAGKIFLQFNVIDVLKEKYHIKRISAEKGFVNAKVFEDGKDNYHFWKPIDTYIDTSYFEIHLQRVIFKEFIVKYTDKVKNIDADIVLHELNVSGNFHQKQFDADFYINIFPEVFVFSGNDIVKKTDYELAGNVFVNTETGEYSVKNGFIKAEDIKLLLSGEVTDTDNGSIWNIEVSGNRVNVDKMIALISTQYTEHIKKYKIKGILDFNLLIDGKFDAHNIPLIIVKSDFRNGTIVYQKTKTALKNVNVNLLYKNTDIRNPQKAIIELKNISATLDDGSISGNLKINGLSKSEIDCDLKMDIDFVQVNKFVNFEDMTFAKGKLQCDITFHCKFDDINKISAKDFLRSKSSGYLKGKDIIVNHNSWLHEIYIPSFEGEFNQTNLLIKKAFFQTAGVDLVINNSKVQGMFPYYILNEGKIEIDGNFNIRRLLVDDILETLSKSQEQQIETGLYFDLTDNIALNANFVIDEMLFAQFYATNITSQVILKNKKLILRNFDFKSLDGNIYGDIIIDATDGKNLIFKADASLINININKLFYQMNNFGQSSLTHNNINGIAKVYVNHSSVWSKDLVADLSSVKIIADIEINNGAIKDYVPLMILKKYIKNRDFKNVEFSKMQNQIVIENKNIKIPKMNINSSAMNFNIEGTHTFDNEIDYRMNVLLSELRGRESSQKLNVVDEYGYVEDDGLGRTKWFFRIKGAVDTPLFIPIDREAIKDNIKPKIESERKVLKQILHKEFGLFKGDSTIQQQPEVKEKEKKQFIIEWEDE